MFYDNIISLDDAMRQNLLPALDTFACPYSTDIDLDDGENNPASSSTTASSGIIRIVFPEFTCVCPKTGYPDFAAIRLCYLPNKLCLELKSWKLYLNAFRMIGTFHETVTAHLFTTLKNLLDPKWMMLIGAFFPRGNVDTTVLFETDTPRPKGVDVLLGDFLK